MMTISLQKRVFVFRWQLLICKNPHQTSVQTSKQHIRQFWLTAVWRFLRTIKSNVTLWRTSLVAIIYSYKTRKWRLWLRICTLSWSWCWWRKMSRRTIHCWRIWGKSTITYSIETAGSWQETQCVVLIVNWCEFYFDPGRLRELISRSFSMCLRPRLQHIRVAGKYFSDVEIPVNTFIIQSWILLMQIIQ